jgi:Matrixin
MKGQRCATAALLALLLSGLSPAARAYCRTTTCNPAKPADNCQFDGQQCETTGKPLGWRSSCVTIGVQRDGSPKAGFTFDDVTPVVEQAFSAWMKADCGGGSPSIDVQLLGPVECGLSEYNSDAGNSNIVLFREDSWPFAGAANAIAITTTRFDPKSGDLWDADIELNAVTANLSIGDPVKGDDLLSVLTHEAGHFLGLAHSRDAEATMKYVYDPTIDGTNFRTLAPDDIAGICAAYPPDRKPATGSCENRHGFSEQCGDDQPARNESKGCSLNTRAVTASSSWGGYALALGVCLGRARRRLARRRSIV